jgi:hypothetical protein
MQEAASFWQRDNEHCRKMSHWTEYEKLWAGDYALYQVTKMRRLWELACRPLPASIVEWGVGGGAVASRFAGVRYYGVDISAANLAEAVRICGVNFTPLLIDIDKPEDVLTVLRDVDFFLSVATYQHFPSQEYGERVTRVAYELLQPSGLAVIQTRSGGPASVRCYAKDYARFTTWTLDEFKTVAERIGFDVLKAGAGPGDYVYYGLQKPDA